MLKLDRMLLIGSKQRKAGKTTLACELIKKFSKDYKTTAIKITRISKEYPDHDMADDSELLKKGYSILEEKNCSNNTDTSKFLAAGAKQSFWLRVLDDCLLEGFTSLLKRIEKDAVIICESTSLIRLVKPGVFVMIPHSCVRSRLKKDIEWARVDKNITIQFDGGDLKSFIGAIIFKSDKWKIIN